MSGLQVLLFLFVLMVANSPDLHHSFAGHDHAHCPHHAAAGHDRPTNPGHDPEQGCVVWLINSGAAEAPGSAGPPLFAAIETILRPAPFPEAEVASAVTTVFDRGPPVP